MRPYPLVAREALARGRSWSTAVGLSFFCCLLGGFAMAVFSLAISGAPDRRPNADDMANAASLVASVQIAVVVLVVTFLGSTSISADRERGTLDLLLVGRLSPWHLAWTSLVASTAYPVLLVVMSLPILAAAFLYAGLDLGQVALVELVAMVTVATVGAIGTVASVLATRRVAATIAAYGAVLTLYGMTALAGTALTGGNSIHPVLFANPLYAAHAVATGGPANGGVEPWQASIVVQALVLVLCIRLTAAALARPTPAGRRARAAAPA